MKFPSKLLCKHSLALILQAKKIVYEHRSSPRFVATIDFEDQGDQTFIRWHMLFETAEQFIQVVKTFKADEGLKQNVEKLTVYLAGLKTPLTTKSRSFNQ